FVECTVDPVSGIELSGREGDGTFRISGSVRSYKGSVFYGRTFDRNFRLGVDFVPEKGEDGYNNMPLIYGSAETFSDTSRLDRVKITLLTKDPETNALKERGRFNEISFRVSSDHTDVQEEVDEKFYKDVGLDFITAEGAGSMAAALGEEYIKRYFMQKIGKKLADAVGLDMINLETSIASNYFNHFTGEHEQQPGVLRDYWRSLTFGNIGVTIGRYFLRDQFFLKWRTELVPSDDMELSREHSLGLEYQPSPYFILDGNIGFRKNENEFIYNPSMRMLLRIPFGSTGTED
ncbi:MAG: hypothetical protein ACOCSE_04050, partial [Chitinivibrionales bacterium]